MFSLGRKKRFHQRNILKIKKLAWLKNFSRLPSGSHFDDAATFHGRKYAQGSTAPPRGQPPPDARSFQSNITVGSPGFMTRFGGGRFSSFSRIYMGGAINGGTRKWRVYKGKSWKIRLRWMIWGYPHLWKSPYSSQGLKLSLPCQTWWSFSRRCCLVLGGPHRVGQVMFTASPSGGLCHSHDLCFFF